MAFYIVLSDDICLLENLLQLLAFLSAHQHQLCGTKHHLQRKHRSIAFVLERPCITSGAICGNRLVYSNFSDSVSVYFLPPSTVVAFLKSIKTACIEEGNLPILELANKTFLT